MNHCTKKIAFILCLAILLLSMSCKSAAVDANKESEIVIVDVPKIAFVTYKISKGQEGNTIELIDVIKAEGKLKSKEKNQNKIAGNYELIQLDKNGNQLVTTTVENPLNQTVEYIQDNGELTKKDLTFQSKEIAIRVQIQARTSYLLMQEIGNESKNYLKTKL